MTESKGHNLLHSSQNSLKSKSGHLNIDPNLYQKYQNPSLRGFQDIVLTDFSIAIMAESKTGHNPVNILRNLLQS